jgi:DNA modification methylase
VVPRAVFDGGGETVPMRRCIPMSRAELARERPAGADDDVHFLQSLVAEVVDALTEPGDRVLDPFCGFGTTLAVAARMQRKAVGVELLEHRAELARRRVSGGDARVVTGDARRLAELVSGPVDLCLTSPPYMTASGHPENPLTGYATTDADYDTYLDELTAVLTAVGGLTRPGGHVVVNVANVVDERGTVTPLAWDVGCRLARELALVQDVALCWDEPPPGIAGDYCLVFRR